MNIHTKLSIKNEEEEEEFATQQKGGTQLARRRLGVRTEE
jgi:hypothetical protein